MPERVWEQTCDAIFKNGVFQPLNVSEIEITEGQKVKLIIEPLDSSEDILELASCVYEGLSEEQIGEIEHLIINRDSFFNGRPST
jgi:predicted DNA-binding antitoxin AbrB/MazE fold protein